MMRWSLAILALAGGMAVAHADGYLVIQYKIGFTETEVAPMPGGPGGAPAVGPGVGGSAGGKQPAPMGPGVGGSGAGKQPSPGPGVGGSAGGRPGMSIGLGPGTAPTTQPPPAEAPIHYVTLTGVVEYSKESINTLMGAQFFHKYGVSAIYIDPAVDVIKSDKILTMPKTFELKRSKLKTATAPQATVELAIWALDHGLVTEHEELMEEVIKSTDKSGKAPPEVTRVVGQYKKAKALLAQPPTDEKTFEHWQKILKYSSLKSAHYGVLHEEVGNSKAADVRLQRLESNLKRLYYWFALRDVELPAPTERFVAVVTEKGSTYERIANEITQTQGLSHYDGILARRSNVVLLCGQRVDPYSRALNLDLRGVYELEVAKASLLQSPHYVNMKLKATSQQIAILSSGKPADVQALIRAETMALLERELDEQSEVAGITAEGSRQVLTYAGLIPRSVRVPAWYERGLTSYFETPRGPFAGAPKEVGAPLWTATNGGRWAYLRPLQGWIQAPEMLKKAESDYKRAVDADSPNREERRKERDKMARSTPKAKPGELLIKTVSDTLLFSKEPIQGDYDPLLFGRALSWGLGAYLIDEQFASLRKFTDEMAKMPRDLELDSTTRVLVFARAFDLTDPKTGNVDLAKVISFEKAWFQYIQNLRPPEADIDWTLQGDTVPPPLLPPPPEERPATTPTTPVGPGRSAGPGGPAGPSAAGAGTRKGP